MVRLYLAVMSMAAGLPLEKFVFHPRLPSAQPLCVSTKALGTQPASSNWRMNLPHTQHVLYEHVSAAPSKGE